MTQKLRITIGYNEYYFQILNDTPIAPGVKELRVLVDGEPLTILREGNSWIPSGATPEFISLAEAIGKAIVLRYRI